MELPSYSKQLLQQLYALCKEQQFCDCTIFIGTVHFRAHKVVLAAASLLFKSLLDSTDTISIDASVVTPEEFALLLEMMYTGKLPLGKHNFTKVISVADSLQMFDVAVSCKKLLRDLISCSTQDQVVRDVSSQAADSSANDDKANNPPQAEKPPSEVKTDTLLPQKASSSPGPAEAEMEADVSGQELTTNHTLVHQDIMPSDSKSFREESSSHSDHHSHAERDGCVEEEVAEPLEKRGRIGDLAAESKSCKLDFFLRYESVFSEALSDVQTVLKRLEEYQEIDASQREALVACLEEVEEESVFKKLLGKVKDEQSLDAQTLVSFLKLFQDTNPRLKAALLERDLDGGEALQHTESAQEKKTLAALLLDCREELIQSVTQLSPIVEFLETAEEGFLTALEKRIVLDCCEGSSHREAMENLLKKVDEEKTLKAESLVKLLGAVKGSFPGLHLLLDNLVARATVSDGKAKWSLEDYGAKLLRRYQENFAALLTDTQTLLQGISAAQNLAPGEREVMEQIVKCETGSGGFVSLASAALDEQSLSVSAIWQLLLAVREAEFPLNVLMEEIQKEPGADFFFQAVATSESTAIEIILRHSKLISEAIKQRADLEGLAPGEAGLTEAVKELLSISAQKESSEASLKAALSTVQEKSVPAIKICQLLCNVHESFPDLQPVMQELGHVGMQYHKLTEHFDEKPFSCEECGAKFAANSTLKNHLRLHTGDRPFMCKHCLMTFMQASALAYHTKKKHSEGKMYACQYCDAVFAQSIELSRHVRTHTGDKPYVCRECGKGFRQANGLSIHLRTFHNIEDPYDCKKCRMSFATLQEHRKHVHEAHSREYHPCPTCAKVFSAPSLLERHMVTHVGGKPFSCEICDKAYQQLSGLWYHNRTHHPDVFAAQNHRSSKFSSLQCSSCDKTFSSTTAHRKHVKEEHTDVKFHECETCKELFPTLALLQVHVKCRHSGSQPFRCLYCSASFRFPGALQQHVTTEHFKQTESTFTCGLCGELFTSQGELEGHYSAEHPKVVFTEAQATTAQIVQVIQTSEHGAAEHIISFDEAQLAGSQVFVTLPDSQVSQAGSELVAVTMEDLFDDKVTLICEETK
ncbi:zinc finger and BTB domain-containing protein 40 isoform X5 [Apteryx mantelli]|uniref:Zinc finger and BTB domain-containing protein 40 isoform X5 n=1 Tax=Apteryx mantelli TaxID=2696672 RepID=A0ABM4FQH0_9AVES